jgi:hypothetical protein
MASSGERGNERSRALFIRIVPTLKDIGLWGRRIQAAFEDMGVLEFASLNPEEGMSAAESEALRIERELRKARTAQPAADGTQPAALLDPDVAQPLRVRVVRRTRALRRIRSRTAHFAHCSSAPMRSRHWEVIGASLRLTRTTERACPHSSAHSIVSRRCVGALGITPRTPMTFR